MSGLTAPITRPITRAIARAITGMGAAAAAANRTGILRSVVTTNALPNILHSLQADQDTVFLREEYVIAGGAVDTLVLSFSTAGWAADGYIQPDPGFTQHWIKVAIELPAAYAPGGVAAYATVTFSGARNADIPIGTVDFQSDDFVIADKFPGLTTLPRGAHFYVRAHWNLTNPANEPNFVSNSGRSWLMDAPVTAVNGVDSTGDFTFDGTTAEFYSGTKPVVLGYYADGDPLSVFMLGGIAESSVTHTTTPAFNPKYMRYAMTDADGTSNPIAYTELADIEGTGTGLITEYVTGNDALWQTFLQYHNTFLFAQGGNRNAANQSTRLANARSMLEIARTTYGMKTLWQNCLPRSTDPGAPTDYTAPQDQTVVATAEAESLTTDDAIVADYALNRFDYMYRLTDICEGTSGDDRGKWAVNTVAGVAPPLTADGIVPISASVHELRMAPAVRTALAAVVLAPSLDRQTLTSVGTTVMTPQVRTNMAGGTLYMIVIPNADVAAFDALAEATKVARVKAGMQSDGVTAASAAQSAAVIAAGTQTMAQVTGLTAATAYKAYWVHARNALDSVVRGVAITTASGTVLFDAVSNGHTDNGTSVTVTHTPVAAAGVSGYGVWVAMPTSATVTALTLGGVNILPNLVATAQFASAAHRVALYKTVALPPQGVSGPVEVVATLSASVRCTVGVIGVTGGLETDVFAAAVTANGTSTTPNVAVPCTSAQLVAAGFLYAGTGTATAEADETLRWNPANSAGNRGAGTTQAGAVEATADMRITITSGAWCAAGAPFKAAA